MHADFRVSFESQQDSARLRNLLESLPKPDRSAFSVEEAVFSILIAWQTTDEFDSPGQVTDAILTIPEIAQAIEARERQDAKRLDPKDESAVR